MARPPLRRTGGGAGDHRQTARVVPAPHTVELAQARAVVVESAGGVRRPDRAARRRTGCGQERGDAAPHASHGGQGDAPAERAQRHPDLREPQDVRTRRRADRRGPPHVRDRHGERGTRPGHRAVPGGGVRPRDAGGHVALPVRLLRRDPGDPQCHLGERGDRGLRRCRARLPARHESLPRRRREPGVPRSRPGIVADVPRGPVVGAAKAAAHREVRPAACHRAPAARRAAEPAW